MVHRTICCDAQLHGFQKMAMKGQRVTSLSARMWTSVVQGGAGLDPWVVPTAAARLRAAVVRRLLRRFGRGLAYAAGAGMIEPLRRRRNRAALYRELMARDDRLLRDIGITRGEIPLVVQGTLWARAERPLGLCQGEAVYGEFTAKEDRVLREVGIVRGDVPALAGREPEDRVAADAAGRRNARQRVGGAANDDRGSGAAA